MPRRVMLSLFVAAGGLAAVALGGLTGPRSADPAGTAGGEAPAAAQAEPITLNGDLPEECTTHLWPYIPPDCMRGAPDKSEVRVPVRVMRPEDTAHPVRGEPISRERLDARIAEIAERPRAAAVRRERGGAASEAGAQAVVAVIRGAERTEYVVARE